MDAVTICATNYLPFANILGNSFLKHNPQSTFSLLVIDSEFFEFEKNPSFKYLTLNDLEVSAKDLTNMSFYYNVTEFATALKPSVLKKLFSLGSQNIVYLDPDIQVFGRFEELEKAFQENELILTPHTINPMPRDGLRPTEADIMASGTFNLGFIALSKSDNAIQMLDWWEQRLRFDSISEPEKMLFTDQRWIDLVPSYFPIHVFREPTYNVAYWNLHERHLTKIDSKVLVNNLDLKFFHFSGYRPEKPWILSKYVEENPRVVISQNQILRELCQNYGDLVQDVGLKTDVEKQYGFNSFEDGKPIPSSLRRLYREDCIDANLHGVDMTPPSNWKEWATSRSISSGNLSRILFSLWKSRPDLMRRFPDATGNEAHELQEWARNHGIAENAIDEEFIEIGDLVQDSYPNFFSDEKGINIAGYLTGELGLGQSARLIYESAKKTKFPTHPLVSNRSRSRQFESFSSSELNKIFGVIVAVINADHFKLWIDDIGKNRLKKSTIIGVWAWETEDFPRNMHSAFELVDEIWAVSNFVKSALEKHTQKPIFVFPTPISNPERIEKLDRSKISLNTLEDYNLFIFDYLSVFNRKNPLGAIEAHTKAFPNGDGPTLVIKTINSDKDPVNRERLRFAIEKRKDIVLIENYLSREQMTALINECSTYISLHRSEGYGLTIAEAMILGRPVIATGYSGNLDFMSQQNSFLVPYELIKVGDFSPPYLSESKWADPDLNTAAEYMRYLFENKDLAQEVGRRAKLELQEKFSVTNAANFIDQRITYHYSLRVKLLKRMKVLKAITIKARKATKSTIKFAYKALKSG